MIPPLVHTKIIGIGHKARQGKDLAASLLEELAPGRVRRFPCSAGLYAYCRIRHGMTRKDPPLLQDVGLNWRQRDPDIWVRCALWAIHDWDQDARGPQVALITDVRFPNEAAAVLNTGGQLVRIVRSQGGEPVRATDRPLDHPSETALDDFPWPITIENSGSIAAFAGQIAGYAQRLAPAVFGSLELEDAA